MDDTQDTRTAEAATKKRRSSILKNLRPSRTPFSELEFNVATPTDTTKSRRVSFSRRTGVAEFVTNEATNLWKTIYVEQNKSLESSENDIVMNQPHQTVGCLGKRIFDQQFEEIEVVDYGGNIISAADMGMRQMNMSMSVNFANQIASLECEQDERKLAERQHNFELSAMTDHRSNLFGDGLPITATEDASNKIDINFSAIQPIGMDNRKYDDLDEIQRDYLSSEHRNLPGPRNTTQYTEMDLNTTYFGMKIDGLDMSITDTVQDPEVKEASRSKVIIKRDSINNDWIADKENIAFNPYVSPKQSPNYVTNEMQEPVLVCDGPNMASSGNLVNDEPRFVLKAPDKQILDKVLTNASQRSEQHPSSHTIIYDGGDVADVSITQAIPANIVGNVEKRKTIVFENETGNLSLTQALPVNIVMVSNKTLSNKTIFCDQDISFTQVVPPLLNRTNNKSAQDFDLSLTQAVPNNLVIPNKINQTNKANTIVYENDSNDISITRALPSNIINCENQIQLPPSHNNGIYSISDQYNISETRILPSNIIECNKLKDTVELNDKLEGLIISKNIDMSLTEVIPDKILYNGVVNDETKTVNGIYDVSITEVIPSNIVDTEKKCLPETQPDHEHKPIFVVNSMNKTIDLKPETLPDKTNTVLNISVKAVKECMKENMSHIDMSITHVVHPNDAHNRNGVLKHGRLVSEGDRSNISMTQSIKTNILLSNTVSESDGKLLLDEKESDRGNRTSISVCNCMVITSNQPYQIHICTHSDFPISKGITENSSNRQLIEKEKEAAVSEEYNVVNVSKNSAEHNEILIKSMNYLDGNSIHNLDTNNHKSITDHNYQDVFVYQAVTSHNVSKHQMDGIKVEEGKSVEQTTIEESKKPSTDSNLPDQSLSNENKKTDKNPNSFLDTLLNMSKESINLSSEGIDDKNIMAVIESQNEMDSANKFKSKTNGSEPLEEDSGLKEKSIGTKSFLYHKNETDNMKASNEKVVNRKSENISNKSIRIIDSKTDLEDKYLKEAKVDDLLEAVSDLTEKTMAKQPKLEDISNPIRVNDQIKSDEVTVEDKTDPKRLSIPKSRMSIMMSREDLLNNISTAQALLEQANDMDDSEMFNSTNDTTEEDEDNVELDGRSKQPRVSAEIVKTLQFDDSVIDAVSQSSTNITPLKKTTFGDVTSMKEDKGKVIPPFLMDLSEDIKSLMHDLVKPTADAMPFDTGIDRIVDKTPKRYASTHSTEVQANIITSSQIDIDINSGHVSKSNSFGTGILAATNKNPLSDLIHTKPGISGADGGRISNNSRKNVFPKPYLVFDQTNPLNNVILAPTGAMDVHNYSPIQRDSKPASEASVHVKRSMSEHSPSFASEKESKSNEKIKVVSTQFNVKIDPIPSDIRADDLNNKSMAETASAGEEPVPDLENDDEIVKDREVNTLIVMKSNQNILQTNSSLTTVDDDIEVVTEDMSTVDLEMKPKKTSPVKVIFKLDDQDDENSELSDSDNARAKKRHYSPAKYSRGKVIPSGLDTTPKPSNKMQKISSSPFKNVNRASTVKINHSAVEQALGSERSFSRNSPKKSPKSSFKSGHSVIVQRMAAECNLNKLQIYGDFTSEFSSSSTLKTELISQKDFSSMQITESLSDETMKKTDQIPSSVTTTTSGGVGILSSDPSQLDYPAEDQDKTRDMEIDCEDSVISKINQLPFIGTPECEWDHSEVNSWRFLLMRKALRLTVRLKGVCPGEHRWLSVNDGAPIESTAVEHLHEETDAVAAASARLASEAMRYECVRGAALAGELPSLLRRCVAVGRVAGRWARAMREARVHLAYSLADSGRLVLRVANVPLRSVYEVCMRVELVVEDARETAWPRAGNLTLQDITEDREGEPSAEVERWMRDVQRVIARVPHDWGHVPRTLWKVFRYLKNKTRDVQLAV